ncbi:MAG: YbjN domain-containing protein [Rhodospirillales bacterium]
MPDVNISFATQSADPLDIIEQLSDANDWTSDRRNNEEIAVQAPGRWCDYSLYFAWNEDIGAMHFTCAFDMRVPQQKRRSIHELLALANEKLWLGHFGMWEEEMLPMFRHVLLARGTRGPTGEQIQDLVETALNECERFYPAFQYVIWGGKPAAEAVTAAMIDIHGEA